jgi:putative ABC transport system permease protein
VTPVLLPKPASTAERLAALAEDSVFLSSAAQSALGLKPGDEIEFQAGTQYRRFKIAGEIPGAAENRQLAVMDIAAVQSHFGKLGRLTRIDLKLAEGVTPDQARPALQAILPAGVLIEVPEAAADQAGQPVAGLSGQSDHAGGDCLADRRLSRLFGAGAVGGAPAQ